VSQIIIISLRAEALVCCAAYIFSVAVTPLSTCCRFSD